MPGEGVGGGRWEVGDGGGDSNVKQRTLPCSLLTGTKRKMREMREMREAKQRKNIF